MFERTNGSRAIDREVDGMNATARDPHARRPGLAGFAALNALAAWAGGIGLVTGGTDFGERINERLPFDSVVLAGIALATMVGIPLQEGLEHVQYAITDYLTEASPPMSLRSAVATASTARFLLITAGNVSDERRAAAFIQSGATDRVVVWNIDGADHTGGYDTRPEEWQQRVLEFLDENLV
jgi:hypothetical protein